jgi:hypothetical protein
MLRQFASVLACVAVMACASAPAHATDFLAAIDDVPLVEGLVEKPDPVIFESDQGRVVRTSAEGRLGANAIIAFYDASLPQLGWTRSGGDGYAFQRENETLRIAIREPANNRPVTVSFELIVKLASSRLAD